MVRDLFHVDSGAVFHGAFEGLAEDGVEGFFPRVGRVHEGDGGGHDELHSEQSIIRLSRCIHINRHMSSH